MTVFELAQCYARGVVSNDSLRRTPGVRVNDLADMPWRTICAHAGGAKPECYEAKRLAHVLLIRARELARACGATVSDCLDEEIAFEKHRRELIAQGGRQARKGGE